MKSLLIGLSAAVVLFVLATFLVYVFEDFPEGSSDGRARFHNDTDSQVALVVGPRLTLTDAVERLESSSTILEAGSSTWVTITADPRPGDDDPWCDHQDYWVLQLRDGERFSRAGFDGAADLAVDVGDVEVVADLDGYCWPSRYPDYRITE